MSINEGKNGSCMIPHSKQMVVMSKNYPMVDTPTMKRFKEKHDPVLANPIPLFPSSLSSCPRSVFFLHPVPPPLFSPVLPLPPFPLTFCRKRSKTKYKRKWN